MRLVWRWFVAGICSVCMGSTVPAQSTADTVYHLHGSVLNGVTGRPIGRALVVSPDRRLATMTNAEGHFTLDVSVPPATAAEGQRSTATQQGAGIRFSGGPLSAGRFGGGGLVLTAQRPGYLPSRQGAALTLDATLNTREIVLRLQPAASIRGQVIAPGAEGFRGVRVELLRHSVLDGRPSWQMASMRQVGADGTFTMTDLQPGEYTVATSEWVPQNRLVVDVKNITDQYPPDFLGDTRTLDGATKLHLAYGQSAQANLHLHTARYYPVTIPVQGLPQNSGASVRVAAGAGFQLYQLGWNNRDGTVEGALPNGDYVVTVNAPGSQHAGAQIPLHIADAAVVHAPVGLTPTQDIPVTVRDERTGAGSATAFTGPPQAGNNPGFYLSVRPEDLESGGGGMMQTTGGGPVLQNMMPGRYYLQGNSMGRGYVAAITCDGVNLLTQAMVVNDSGHTAPVEVTLRDDGGTISGTVDLASSNLSAARVIILPSDGSGHVLYSYVTGAGTFQMSNVPPGSYRVFAMPADETETLPYLDAQAMRPYEGRGGAVTVLAGQTAQVKAELVGLNGAAVQP